MNPFYEDAKKKKVVSEDEDVDVESVDSEDQVKSKRKTGKKTEGGKHRNVNEKKGKSSSKHKKHNSSESGSDGESSDEAVATPKKQAKASKKVSSEDCAKFIGSFVDNDRVVIKKAMKILRSFQEGEIKEKKVISRLIKLCGVETAKSIVTGAENLFNDQSLVNRLSKAASEYNWPGLITVIEDQLKEEPYEEKEDEMTKKLIRDYSDIRKNGMKLKRKVVAVLKKLDKKSETYKSLRNEKKQLESYQEECDRCIDESDVNVEELGELILQYSECVNTLVSLLNEPMDISEDSNSDSDYGKKKKIRMPKFDDEDEFDSESDKVRFRNRKAVYKAIIKEPNGKLSMSHITLEPRAQAGIPLPVTKGEVIGFGWKEETGSRMLFRSVLSVNGNDDDIVEIIPLQVRISEYHMIMRIKEDGILRLGWDNSLSLRKSKEIDIFVKRFNADAADSVMEAEEKRQEAWRQVEKSDLTEGNMEGGHLTLKLTARVMTEDGVKYTCHCDWESSLNSLKTQWDVQYPYLVWLEWYQTLKAKYPSYINEMAPFTGTAFMTTKAVVEERLTKINDFFQDLVQSRFMMETPEVVSWFRCQEYIRIAKKEYYEKFRMEREKKLKEAEEEERKQRERVAAAMPNEDEMEDPLSYLCAL